MEKKKQPSAPALPPAERVVTASFDGFKNKLTTFVQTNGRDELILRARISTPTLVAISQGQFPWKGGKRVEERQKRAWARTLTRVALVLNDSPEDWCAATGLGHSHGILEVVNKERDSFTGSGGAKTALGRGGILARIKARTKATVGILDYGPFSETGNNVEFLREFADRLIGTIEPSIEIISEVHSNINFYVQDLGDENKNPHYDLVMGLFDTVHRRFNGIDFVAIPGWQISLSALWFKPLGKDVTEPSWQDLISRTTRSKYVAVVIEGEAGFLYLKGPCRFNNDNLQAVANVRDIRQLAELFDQERKKAERANLLLPIFVADEDTCRKVMAELNVGKYPTERGSIVQPIINAPGECPKYPLGMAFKGGNDEWRSLLDAAMWNELFGNDHLATADLYARLIALGYCKSHAPAKEQWSIWTPSIFKLRSGEQKTKEFWKHVHDQLVEEIFKQKYPTETNGRKRATEDADEILKATTKNEKTEKS